jgi:hypothetical protein
MISIVATSARVWVVSVNFEVEDLDPFNFAQSRLTQSR